MRKTTTVKNCETCNQEMAMPFWLSKVTRFCSKKCSGQDKVKKSQKVINCLVCKKDVKIRNSQKQIFCSPECYWTTIDGKKLNSLSKGTLGWRKNIDLLTKSEKKHLDTQYRQWMFSVKNRDKWKCRIADINCDGRLEAHHILNWKEYPELRYEINNGITLCHAHHPRGRDNEAKLSPFFQNLVAKVK